jgi:hypothetical protein
LHWLLLTKSFPARDEPSGYSKYITTNRLNYKGKHGKRIREAISTVQSVVDAL